MWFVPLSVVLAFEDMGTLQKCWHLAGGTFDSGASKRPSLVGSWEVKCGSSQPPAPALGAVFIEATYLGQSLLADKRPTSPALVMWVT